MAASNMQVLAGTLLVGDGTTTTAGSVPVYASNGRILQATDTTTSADPGNGGAIPVPASGNVYCLITTAGAETRTIAAPAALGISLVLDFIVSGGNCVVTVASLINATGNNTITMSAVGQTIELRSVLKSGTAYRWAVGYNDGTALSTV